jgi:hypothetical protein
MENILPMGKVEWDKLAERYNKRFPSRPRKMVNLRNQFNTYAKAKPPTGDPDCPPLVSRAKRIVELTKEKAGLEVLNDPKKLAKCDVPTVNGSTKDVDGIAAQLSSDPKKVVSSKKKRRSPVDTDALVDALLASEQAQVKREERMEQRRQEDRNETFRLAITAMTSIAAVGRHRSRSPCCHSHACYRGEEEIHWQAVTLLPTARTRPEPRADASKAGSRSTRRRQVWKSQQRKVTMTMGTAPPLNWKAVPFRSHNK